MREQSCSDDNTRSGILTAVPLVSVVLTVYNHADYVREALDSVANATYRRLEIIVINDASQDDTDTIIRQWIFERPDQNVVYINHEQNKGLTKSVNQGIAAAHGDFLYFSSGDDVVLPEGIANLAGYLLANPDKLAVFADCHVIDREGKETYKSGIEGLHRRSGMRKSMLGIDSILRFSIFYHWGFCGPALMMRKETLSIVGPYDEELALDDWDMFLRIAARGKLGFFNGYAGGYRLHDKNSIATNRSRLIYDSVLVARKHADKFTGFTSLRIEGLDAFAKYHESRSLPRKLFYFLKSGALLFLSNYIHRAIRLMLLFRHKYLGTYPNRDNCISSDPQN